MEEAEGFLGEEGDADARKKNVVVLSRIWSSLLSNRGRDLPAPDVNKISGLLRNPDSSSILGKCSLKKLRTLLPMPDIA